MKTTKDLLEEVVKLGFEREYALTEIDYALDDAIGSIRIGVSIEDEYLTDTLYNTILESFVIEHIAKNNNCWII